LIPASPAPPTKRGLPRPLDFRSRHTRHTENGWRSVPLSTTLDRLERFFLASEMEAEFQIFSRRAGGPGRAFLKHLAASGRKGDRISCGKGLSPGQALASACMELLERHCAAPRRHDAVRQVPYTRVAGEAVDPRRFVLAAKMAYDPTAKIDWVWGYSLTRAVPVLVPANLVFYPYAPRRGSQVIAGTDSNGLGAGNNMEEAVLHGLLEVIERDAVMISEYNRLPAPGIPPRGLPDACRPVLDLLEKAGYRWSFKAVPTDWPFPVVAAFIAREKDPRDRSVAFGSHLGRAQALERALTEAIQVLPPSANHAGWLRSGSSERYARRASKKKAFARLADHPTDDIKTGIERCVAVLRDAGSEVIVVDLSLPDIPFPAVRVLATGLQPSLRKSDKRISARFSDVPVKLGFRARPRSPDEVEIWPLCGYR
jgi:ribosomal protein S12 methylthiotransferase accessory factor YcaO